MKTFPIKTPWGSLFLKDNKIYIRFKNQRIATGLDPTSGGIRMAMEKGEALYRASILGIAPDTNKKILASEAFAEFIAEKRARNNAPRTIDQYERVFGWLCEKGEFVLTKEAIRERMIAHLARTDLNAQSKYTNLNAFFVFLNWCNDHEPKYLTELPKRKNIMPLPDAKEHTIYTPDECALLFKYFETHNPLFGLLLQFLYHSGFRPHEVLEMLWSDVIGDEIKVKAKDGRSWQYVPNTPFLKDILARVPHTSNKVFPWAVVSFPRLNSHLTNAMDALGIEKNGRAFQCFRRTRATNVMESGATMTELQSVMRHAPAVSAKKYIRPSKEKAYEAAVRASNYAKITK